MLRNHIPLSSQLTQKEFDFEREGKLREGGDKEREGGDKAAGNHATTEREREIPHKNE